MLQNLTVLNYLARYVQQKFETTSQSAPSSEILQSLEEKTEVLSNIYRKKTPWFSKSINFLSLPLIATGIGALNGQLDGHAYEGAMHAATYGTIVTLGMYCAGYAIAKKCTQFGDWEQKKEIAITLPAADKSTIEQIIVELKKPEHKSKVDILKGLRDYEYSKTTTKIMSFLAYIPTTANLFMLSAISAGYGLLSPLATGYKTILGAILIKTAFDHMRLTHSMKVAHEMTKLPQLENTSEDQRKSLTCALLDKWYPLTKDDGFVEVVRTDLPLLRTKRIN